MSFILRIFFRLLYQDFAWAYDLVSATVSGGRWREWTASICSLLQGPDVLELGFGPGHLLLRLTSLGFHATGLDSSRQMVNLARKRAAREKIVLSLVRGLGQALPFRAESFNCVAATFPTNFIFQMNTLHDVRRILKPGGALVTLLSAWITDRSILGRILAWLFQITGQTLQENMDETQLLKPFSDAGLAARLHWITLKGSRLLVVVATKDTLDSSAYLY